MWTKAERGSRVVPSNAHPVVQGATQWARWSTASSTRSHVVPVASAASCRASFHCISMSGMDAGSRESEPTRHPLALQTSTAKTTSVNGRSRQDTRNKTALALLCSPQQAPLKASTVYSDMHSLFCSRHREKIAATREAVTVIIDHHITTGRPLWNVQLHVCTH